MATMTRSSRYTNEELARLGDEIYERDIAPKMGPEDQGKVVVIEVESGDFEVDKDGVAADDRLRARHPDALFWFRRVGSRYLFSFGHPRGTAAGARGVGNARQVLYTRDMDTLRRRPRYSSEETARRGEEIFERDIRPQLAGKDDRWFVAIDIETGDYEVAPSELTATDAVFARHPDAQIWMRRVGSRYVYRFGHHRKTA